MPTPTKRKRKKSTKSLRRSRGKGVALALAISSAAILILFTSLYLYVDWMIEGRLSGRLTEEQSAIYSDSLEVRGGLLLDKKLLIKQLERREYRLSDQPPTHAGEYYFNQDSNILRVNTRPFRSGKGEEIDSVSLAIDLQSGSIKRADGAKLASFLLEPEVLQSFNSQAARASHRVSLSEIPNHLKKAVIAIEDERFYSHFGVDPYGIARAIFANIRALRWVQGGSTISQQLVKNLFLSPHKTLTRKIIEVVAALSIERHLSKDEILETYLNETYLGQEGAIAIHGVAEASHHFFHKDVKDLSLSEAALIAGIIKAPSSYNPRRHLKRAIIRRNLVLRNMQLLGYISTEEELAASKVIPKIAQHSDYQKRAPFLLTSLMHELGSYLEVNTAIAQGISVQTGISIDMQQCAETALQNGLDKLEATRNIKGSTRKRLEGAIVAIEPHSGKIRAWVGGRNFGRSQFDRVSQAKRQIGSTVKPFLYLTALDAKLNNYRVATPLTEVSDTPINIELVTDKTWEPENYDRQFRGDVTFRYALEHSLNIPAVYIAQRVGIPALIATLRNFRVADDLPAVPALALGAADTTLLRLAAAYAALANGGNYVLPRLFTVARSSESSELLAESPLFESRVADEAAVYVLTNMLQGVIERGTARKVRSLGFNAPVAGKTGTSNDSRDNWFVGFTPDLSVAVWVGYDDNTPTGLTGAQAATPIWVDFMQCAAPFHEELDFIPPPGVIFSDVDISSGGRATPDCPKQSVVREVFVRGTEPTRLCQTHLRYDHDQNRQTAPNSTHEQLAPHKPRQKGLWELLFE